MPENGAFLRPVKDASGQLGYQERSGGIRTARKREYGRKRNGTMADLLDNRLQLVDLRMIQSGSEQCSPGHSFGPARRDHYLFHYVISGNGTLYGSGANGESKSFTVESGQGFMIYPYQLNTYVADLENPWEYVWVEFDGLCVRSSLAGTELSRNRPVYRANSTVLRENMVTEMQYISAHPETGTLCVTGHLYLFLDYLMRSAKTEQLNSLRRMQDYYIHAAIAFIEAHFQERIRIDELASVCGIERSYFSKIFRESVGVSPQTFIMNYRMGKAETLLRETEMPIGEIAAAVGYENPLHFSRAFKNARGISPREWRERCRAGFAPDCTK